jgi:hypothetical protein
VSVIGRETPIDCCTSCLSVGFSGFGFLAQGDHIWVDGMPGQSNRFPERHPTAADIFVSSDLVQGFFNALFDISLTHSLYRGYANL